MNKNSAVSAAMLPHAPPMLMLDERVDIEGSQLTTFYRVSDTHPLYCDSGFSALAGIELLAQAAGILFGSQQAAASSRPSRGAVVQIKEFEVYGPPLAAGTEVSVQVQLIGGTDQVVMMTGRLECQQTPFMNATLMIALFSGDQQ